MNWYYISFATETEFLGATIVEGLGPENAIEIATNNNLNPGGQALVLPVPDEVLSNHDILPLKYKLLNKEEMLALGSK